MQSQGKIGEDEGGERVNGVYSSVGHLAFGKIKLVSRGQDLRNYALNLTTFTDRKLDF